MSPAQIVASLMVGASAFSFPGVAFAQSDNPSAPTNSTHSNSQDTSGDIVITALKRETTVLKTPAAITVLNGDMLKERGVNNLSDIQNVAPSVNVANGRDGLQIAVRGVTTTDTSSKGSQDIAFNIDGVYYGRGWARGGAFFDIERVEVLRGPQGTLYGRSSTGGAINVITRKPQLGETSGYLRAEYGNFDAKRAEGALNVPIGSAVAIRLSGNFNNRDGYSRPIDYSPEFNGTTYTYKASSARARNDQDDATGRLSILVEPSKDFSARFTVTIGHQGGAGSAMALETMLQKYDDRGVKALQILANPVPAYLDNKFRVYDFSTSASFGGVRADLLASIQDVDFKQQGTNVQAVESVAGKVQPNFLPAPPFGSTFTFYLQRNKALTKQAELRFSNENPGFIDYVIGANYFDERIHESGQTWNAQIPDPLDQSQYYMYAGPVNVTTHKSYGFFGQATVNATDKLGIVAGVRYTNDKLNRVGRFALPFNFGAGFPPPAYPDVAGNAVCTYPNDCVGDVNNGNSNDSKVTWRLGLNYQATPRDLFYASIATGFKPGGFNDYDPANNLQPGRYAPSSVTAYELGYKGRPVTGLTLSTALFYYNYSKYQVNSFVQFSANPVVQGLYTDSTPVKIYGFEGEASYALGRNTSLSGSMTLLHSEYVNFVTGSQRLVGNPVDFTGLPLDLAPELTLTGAFEHAFELGGNTKLKFRVATKYSSAYYLSSSQDGIRYRQPGYTRSDASLTYDVDGGRYFIQAFVENIENKIQRTSWGATGYAAGVNGTDGVYGGVGSSHAPSARPDYWMAFYTTSPRLYGLRLGAKF